MVSLGILALALGVILRLTVAPTLGWALTALGFGLIISGLVVGAVWRFSRTGKSGTVH